MKTLPPVVLRVGIAAFLILIGYVIFVTWENNNLKDKKKTDEVRADARRFANLPSQQMATEVLYNVRVIVSSKIVNSVSKTLEIYPPQHFELRSAILRDSGAVCMWYGVTKDDKVDDDKGSIIVLPSLDILWSRTGNEEDFYNAWGQWCRTAPEKGRKILREVSFASYFGFDSRTDWEALK